MNTAENCSVKIVIDGYSTWRIDTFMGEHAEVKKGRAVSIQECKRDNGSDLHHGRLPTYTRDFPDLFFPLMVTSIYLDPGGRSGIWEVDGSDPPFSLPGSGAAALRNLHLRNTPWEGRSRPINP